MLVFSVLWNPDQVNKVASESGRSCPRPYVTNPMQTYIKGITNIYQMFEMSTTTIRQKYSFLRQK